MKKQVSSQQVPGSLSSPKSPEKPKSSSDATSPIFSSIGNAEEKSKSPKNPESSNIEKKLLESESSISNTANPPKSEKIEEKLRFEEKKPIVDTANRTNFVNVKSTQVAEDTGRNINEKTPLQKKVTKMIEDNNNMELTPTVIPSSKPEKLIPLLEKPTPYGNPSCVAVPRHGSSRPVPKNLNERPLTLATHLVPSLPIVLFEILGEVIEVATGQAVVIVHEARPDRPVAKDLIDIAVLPASDDWEDGSLVPVSFVFKHRLNKTNNPAVYVDVVVAQDCMRNVEEILDLRGYRCALPDRRKPLGCTGFLFSHLKLKGENPSFFGNTLDSGSQLAALQMVAGKQAEVGVVESPVINCHRKTLPGAGSLGVLESLGPLPPYRIMLNKKFDASLRKKIVQALLDVEKDESWMERLGSFGVTGFAEYSEDFFDFEHVKNVPTSVPYY